jgi:hypothetical protein
VSIISDKNGRPVYVKRDNRYVVYRIGKFGSYECDDERTYDSVEDVLADYPEAVKHVEKRIGKAKKRHPDTHYRPSGKAAQCLGTPGSTLGRDQWLNCKATSDISKVTCKHCLKQVRTLISNRLKEIG